MFVGHFAVAMAAKKAVPETSLGTLILSAQFLDLLWPLFLLIGAEHVGIDPGNTPFTPLDFYDYPLSHSLLTTVGWAVVVGGIHFLFRRDARTAVVLYCVVLSHWVLDLLTHRPDLPLVPSFDVQVGFGLWHSVLWTILVEFAMFASGIALFLRGRAVQGRSAGAPFWILVGFLVLVWTANIVGPPPPSEQAVAIAGLSMWLFVAWGYWIDRTPTLVKP